MVSLLWKESRERLLWALALALISAYAAWTRGYTFYGSPGPEMVTWSVGPILMAFLMGASSYTSELTSQRALFLLTRPVSWSSVFASKLVIGAAALLVAAVAAGATYWITCPEAYSAHLTASALASGVGYAAAITAVAYLIGLSCSSVIAGAAESAAFAILQGTALIYALGVAGARSDAWWPQVMQFFWPIPMLAAGLMLSRFGLTLPARVRLRRYAIAASAGLALFIGLVYLTPDSLTDQMLQRRLNHERIQWSISPDGSCAFGRDMRSLYWLDIRRDERTTLESIYQDYSGKSVIFEDVGWVTPHAAYRICCDKDSWSIRTYCCDGKRVSHRDIPMGELTDRDGYPNSMLVSPDGRIAAVTLSTGMDLPQRVVFADITMGTKLSRSSCKGATAPAWWGSDRRFLLIDAHGGRREIAFDR